MTISVCGVFADNFVEDCAWSPDGSLLVIVDSGGKLIVCRSDTFQSLFSYVSISACVCIINNCY